MPPNQLYKKIGIFLGIVTGAVFILVAFLDNSESGDTLSKPVSKTVSQSSSTPTTKIVLKNEVAHKSSQLPQSSNTPVSPTIVTEPVRNTKKTSSVYKDGTYSLDGPYMTPEGQAAINVSLTLTNDIITSANVTSSSGDHTSVRYQNGFISGYKQYVVGKNIADVQLSAISGASLTTEGFNNALAQIRTQAQA